MIDVSTPSAPVQIGSIDTPVLAQAVDVLGDFAYVADDVGGVRKIDVSNPAAPVDVAFLDTPGQALSVDAVDTPEGVMAVVGDKFGGVRVVDFSNPSAPEDFSFLETPSFAQDVRVAGGGIYVAAGLAGLRVVEAEPVPEPSAVAGLVAGAALLAMLRRTRR